MENFHNSSLFNCSVLLSGILCIVGSCSLFVGTGLRPGSFVGSLYTCTCVRLFQTGSLATVSNNYKHQSTRGRAFKSHHVWHDSTKNTKIESTQLAEYSPTNVANHHKVWICRPQMQHATAEMTFICMFFYYMSVCLIMHAQVPSEQACAAFEWIGDGLLFHRVYSDASLFCLSPRLKPTKKRVWLLRWSRAELLRLRED